MIIQIDLSNPKATYLQIVDSVRRAIATGALKPGDKLPTIREAAIQARVNRNTISRAYLELEHLGLVQSRQGSGCFVTEAGPLKEKEESKRVLAQMTDEIALEAYHCQITAEELIDLIRQSMAKLGKEI